MESQKIALTSNRLPKEKSGHLAVKTKVFRGISFAGKTIVLATVSIFTVFPFIWMILSALKTKAEIMDVAAFFPSDPQWGNFVNVFTESPLIRSNDCICDCVSGI